MTMNDKAIRICDNRGFHLDLPNGVTVSVQLGPGNYCDSDVKNAAFDAPKKAMDGDDHWGSNTAECAAYVTGSDLSWVAVPGYTDAGDDDVAGYLSVLQVIDFIKRACKLTGDAAQANPKSYANQMLGMVPCQSYKDAIHGDYRDDPKLQQDELDAMDEFAATDEFFSGLKKFSGESTDEDSA